MGFVLSSAILFIFWIIWSGKFDPFHLTLGVISTLIVSWWSHDLIIEHPEQPFKQRMRHYFKLEKYNVWLVYQIILANIHVIYVAFHPKMNELINPTELEFTTKLKGDYPQFIFGNSITLTPGTVTINIDKNGVFTVHSLTDSAAAGVPGDMETRLIEVFT